MPTNHPDTELFSLSRIMSSLRSARSRYEQWHRVWTLLQGFNLMRILCAVPLVFYVVLEKNASAWKNFSLCQILSRHFRVGRGGGETGIL